MLGYRMGSVAGWLGGTRFCKAREVQCVEARACLGVWMPSPPAVRAREDAQPANTSAQGRVVMQVFP